MKIQPFQFNPFGELTYIVWDEPTHIGAIVDPGMSNAAEQKMIDKFLSDQDITLKYLLYTHLHIDHTLGHEYIVAKYNPEVRAGAADAPLGRARNEQAKMFNLPVEPMSQLNIEKPLTDGELINLGNESLEVIFVPGHSQGSVAYYCKSAGFVLTGDALFNGSIGRTDLPGGNHRQLIESIRARLLSLPPKTIVLPGHGPATTIEREKLTNPYL